MVSGRPQLEKTGPFQDHFVVRLSVFLSVIDPFSQERLSHQEKVTETLEELLLIGTLTTQKYRSHLPVLFIVISVSSTYV